MTDTGPLPPPPPPGGTATATAANVTPAKRKRRWPKVLLIIFLVLLLLIGLVLGGAYFLVKRLGDNITTIPGTTVQAAEQFEPVNILLMGSDSREGKNLEVDDSGFNTGQRSDTTILLHLSADRDWALAVSIPRDTLVELPKCASESGRDRLTMKFNSAFEYGGPNCTVEAVEELSGVDVNHIAVVDFQGFKGLVDALGGVTICLEEATYDQRSRLDLPAGWSTVMGDQALAFVRSRHAFGDGSDIGRIKRQQQFLTAAIQQATDRELLKNPVKLYRVLDAATSALSVDDGLDDITEIRDMAVSVQDLDLGSIVFATMPNVDAGDGANVLVDTRKANKIWRAIRQDEQWPAPKKPKPDSSAGPSDEPAGPEVTVAPEDIFVEVQNGTGADNLATNTSEDLTEVGFNVTGLAYADQTDYAETTIRYNPDDQAAAETLQASTDASVLKPDSNIGSGVLVLIVGQDYAGAIDVDVAGQPDEGSGKNRSDSSLDSDGDGEPDAITADTSICAGS